MKVGEPSVPSFFGTLATWIQACFCRFALTPSLLFPPLAIVSLIGAAISPTDVLTPATTIAPAILDMGTTESTIGVLNASRGRTPLY
jgi:hypothetical protein